MIADSETNVVNFSELLKTDTKFASTCYSIIEILESNSIKYNFIPNTKDIWARDYMPIQIEENEFIEYRYDPDYLQGTGKDKREIKSYPDIIFESLNKSAIKTDIILDGGNVVKSKNTVVLTDKIISENKGSYGKKELINKLKLLFKIENIILIPWDTSERFGHSDGMVRFIDEGTVLLNGIYKSNDDFEKRLTKPFIEKGINLKWLHFNIKNPNKNNWAYINFLRTKDIIILPKLNIIEDDLALAQIKKYFSVYDKANKIFQVDMTQIVKYGGALNCITWTTKE